MRTPVTSLRSDSSLWKSPSMRIRFLIWPLIFSLNYLVGGTRFAHGRRLQDDEAVAKITGMLKGRLCGEDAFRRLCCDLQATQAENTAFGPTGATLA